MTVPEGQYYSSRAKHRDSKMPLLLFKPLPSTLHSHSAVARPTNATHMVIPTCNPYPFLCVKVRCWNNHERWVWRNMGKMDEESRQQVYFRLQNFQGTCLLQDFYCEHGGTMSHQNGSKFLPDYVASYSTWS